LFKTVPRDVAEKFFTKNPQGTEVGRYNPVRPETKQPSFVIQEDKN
jgi:hypothetical protein